MVLESKISATNVKDATGYNPACVPPIPRSFSLSL